MSAPTTGRREGSLEAPTRHPLDRPGRPVPGTGADLRHLPRLPPLRQPVPVVSHPVRSGGRIRHHGGGRCAQGGLLEGGGSLLSLRPLLFDQMPLRAAPRVEPRFSPCNAAGQGGEVPTGRGEGPGQDSHQYRYGGQAGRYPGGKQYRECGEPHGAGPRGAG
jgi:hypothetical protein